MSHPGGLASTTVLLLALTGGTAVPCTHCAPVNVPLPRSRITSSAAVVSAQAHTICLLLLLSQCNPLPQYCALHEQLAVADRAGSRSLPVACVQAGGHRHAACRHISTSPSLQHGALARVDCVGYIPDFAGWVLLHLGRCYCVKGTCPALA